MSTVAFKSGPSSSVSERDAADRVRNLRTRMAAAGLDPTLGAILPMVGVALGALLGGVARYMLDRRNDTAEFVAAARVVRQELELIGSTLKTHPCGPLTSDVRQWLQSQAWPSLSIRLARHLDRDAFGTVCLAMAGADTMYRVLALDTNDRAADVESTRSKILISVYDAIVVLRDF
jgi:hypothetical protein